MRFHLSQFVKRRGQPEVNGRITDVRPVDGLRVLEYQVSWHKGIREWVADTTLEAYVTHDPFFLPYGDSQWIDMDDFVIVPAIPPGGRVFRFEEHSVACMRFTLQIVKEIAEWHQKWPESCPLCEGHGEFFSPATREEPENHEPCSLCMENGLCPRCGQLCGAFDESGTPQWMIYQTPCPNCEWNWGKKEGDATMGAYALGDCECHDRKVVPVMGLAELRELARRL